MDHLTRAAVSAREPELHVDLLTDHAEPAALRVPLVEASLVYYRHWFPRLLRDHGIRTDAVRKAAMRIRFDLARVGDDRGFPGNIVLPFECVVTIVDDRGKVHTGTVRDFWSTEPPPNPPA